MITSAIKNRSIALLSSILLATSLASSPVSAGDRHHRKSVFTDYARVTHVKPKYRIVTERVPQRICDVERGHYQRRHSHHHYHKPQHRVGSVFVHGTIHGTIGREISSARTPYNGPRHAGVVTTHRHNGGHHNYHRPHRKRHCTTTEHVHRTRKPDGYIVTYRFRGQTFRTHTDYHPGDRIEVRVTLTAGR